VLAPSIAASLGRNQPISGIAQIVGRYLGLFQNEEAAALAFNRAAIERYGAFACLNDVPATKTLLRSVPEEDKKIA
jgi:hypothetical protein